MRSETMLSTCESAPAGVGDLVPSFAFSPTDPWTTTFQAGLERAELNGRRVYEVGVGTGTNIAFMLQQCGASMAGGSDLDARLPLVARRLVGEVAPDLLERFRPIEGSVNLIDTPSAMAEVALADVVVACLPQVPDPEDAMYLGFHNHQMKTAAMARRRTDDHIAHYYPWTAFHDYPFNAVGLGLIEALLRKVRACAPTAQVVLTFGCRVGQDVLLRLFRANGYRPEELASCIARQNDRTDISFFVASEAALNGTSYSDDLRCEFFTDPDGRVRISARQAKDMLNADPLAPVYHRICVLWGHPIGPVQHEPVPTS